MSFSCDQDDVAGLGLAQSEPDGRAAVGFDDDVHGGSGQPLADLGDDLIGVFMSRVIARDDRDVGVASDRFPHRAALVAISVASATEHANKAALEQEYSFKYTKKYRTMLI